MTHLLDTDVIINHLKRIKPISADNVVQFAMSVITYAELLYGIEKSPNPTKTRDILKEVVRDMPIIVLSVTPHIVETFSAIKVTLEHAGQRIEDFVLVIAATEMEHNITLIKGKKKHFSRIRVLSLA
ncbi:type II toxin-antitoxin system VapC family toxin [Candidatus Gottesmanbacteria bacterium]|nr:type II toxin-antitoxin system VapC family toxin [Candidatus Gottesmanbacteria bacterium]